MRKSSLGALLLSHFEKLKKKFGKILLVTEDKKLEPHIESENYEVVTAFNDMEVLKSLNMNALGDSNDTTTVDVVIIDVDFGANSNFFDPFSTFHKIRRKFFPNELPIIFLSNQTHREDKRLLEANDYLLKPFSKEDLLARVKNQMYVKKLNDVQTCFVPR